MIKIILAAFLGFLAIALNLKAATEERSFDINNYQGKVVYLDFWASWCVPCRKSFPWMNKMRQKYSNEQLEIIAINLDKEHDLALEFLKNYPAEFTVMFDPKGELAKKYQIPGMPSSILFDQKGKAIEAHGGFFEEKINEYEHQIETAINQNKLIMLEGILNEDKK